MVASRLLRKEVTQKPRTLATLKKSFEKLAQLRPNFVEAVEKASKSAKGLTKFREQSNKHHKLTQNMLSLIDAYVRLHKRTKGEQKIVLPASMLGELERLKLHRGLTSITPTINLRKALDAHNKKQYTLHETAQKLMKRHWRLLSS